MSTGTDLVTAPIHKQLASIAHGGIPSLIPQTIDEVWRFSQLLANSGLTPKGIDSPEKVTVQILMGFDLGLKPMQAVQNIAVINGKPSIGGDLALAVLMTSGLLADHDEWIEGEGDQRVGVCKVERKGMKPIERRFSVSDAVKAGLWQTQPMIRKSYYDKNLKQRVQSKFEEPNDSPWYKYQDRMLCMRARGFAFRDRFSDVLKGMHLTEEMLGHEEEGAPQSQIAGPTPPPPAIESRPQEPAPPANTNAGPAAPPAEAVEDAEIVVPPTPEQERAAEAEHPPLAQEEPFDPEAWLDEVRERFQEARTEADVSDVHEMFADTANDLGMTERQRYEDMLQAAEARVRTQGQPEQAEVTGEPGPAPDEAQDAAQDDEDDIPSADQPAAPPAPSPGDAYYQRITRAVADAVRTYESIAGLWKATKPERDELIANGHLSRERMKEMQASIKARYAKEFGDPAAQAQPAAPAGPGPSAPPAEEDEVTAYDRSFRARVEGCKTIEEIGNLSAGTLAERAKFAGNPLQAEWKALVADRRKQITGVA